MKVYLDTVGCRLNQSEIEKMANQFRMVGHTLVDSPARADLVVVNTCAVTAEAASDSRQKIRQAFRSGAAEIVATGCWATLDPEGAISLSGVSRVVPNERKQMLVADVLNLPLEEFDREPISRQPLPGSRARTRASIKVQDGCDNHCTFCITRIARGRSRSQPVQTILQDIGAALEGGVKEVVLTGVHLGSWGQDFDPPASLRQLVEAVLIRTETPRLRLSSLEPWDLDEEFFKLWQDPRLCRHLHLPLQSGSETCLRRMARKTTPASFARLLEAARAASPDISITTDVIVGFPGETEEEFADSLAFVKAMDFSGGHVFTFSPRPGTAAARYSAQVPLAVRKERNAIMRAALAETAGRYRHRFVGDTLAVLWESFDALGPQGWRMHGLTDNYLRVAAMAPQPLWNTFSRVRMDQVVEDGMVGTIQPEGG